MRKRKIIQIYRVDGEIQQQKEQRPGTGSRRFVSLSISFMKFITKKENMPPHLKTNFYENGEKTGRLLARQLKQMNNQNVITAMKTMLN